MDDEHQTNFVLQGAPSGAGLALVGTIQHREMGITG